jgi:hypothetical protein
VRRSWRFGELTERTSHLASLMAVHEPRHLAPSRTRGEVHQVRTCRRGSRGRHIPTVHALTPSPRIARELQVQHHHYGEQIFRNEGHDLARRDLTGHQDRMTAGRGGWSLIACQILRSRFEQSFRATHSRSWSAAGWTRPSRRLAMVGLFSVFNLPSARHPIAPFCTIITPETSFIWRSSRSCV